MTTSKKKERIIAEVSKDFKQKFIEAVNRNGQCQCKAVILALQQYLNIS